MARKLVDAVNEREQFISLESVQDAKPKFGTKITLDGFPYFAEHSMEELEAILLNGSTQDFIKVYDAKFYQLRYWNVKRTKYLDIQFEFPVPEGIVFSEYLRTLLTEPQPQ